MVDNVLAYKITAIFVIMLSSLCGASLPFVYIRLSTVNAADVNTLDSQPIFFILKALSCGVIIGVALLHLLPDAEETLSGDFSYPISFACAGVGIMLCLSCEQFAMWIVSTTSPATNHPIHDDPLHDDNHNALSDSLIRDADIANAMNMNEADINLPLPPSNNIGRLSVDRQRHSVSRRSLSRTSADLNHSSSSRSGHKVRQHSRADSACEAGMVVQLLAAGGDDTKTLLKAYILEGAIAVHSIIMGVSLGSMGSDELSSIKVLLIAYVIHQLLEGISLGCAISSAKLSVGKVAGLVCFFICTLPAGIGVGLAITGSTDDHVAGLVEGFANGIAGGILIYVSMVEILADEFANDIVRTNYALKVQMIIAISFGLGMMAVLAEWA